MKKKRNKRKEADALRAILEYLKTRKYLAKRNQSGMMFVRYGNRTHAVHMGAPGWADIICCLPNGKFCAIEVKKSKGKLTPAQRDFGRAVLRNNGLFFIARSVQDVINKGL